MTYSLVDKIYPEMVGGRFVESCSTTPDDIAITDLIFNIAGVNLTVINEFHHQHSKNYKLPFYDVKRLTETAVTLYGYDDMPRLDAILFGLPPAEEEGGAAATAGTSPAITAAATAKNRVDARCLPLLLHPSQPTTAAKGRVEAPARFRSQNRPTTTRIWQR
jgi:hypothetical protein